MSRKHILQVNLEDSGGAFALIFQLQKYICEEAIFDYYSMGVFSSNETKKYIEDTGGHVHEANIRHNRLLGSLILPFAFYTFLRSNEYSCIHIHSDTAWKMLVYVLPAYKAKIERIIVHAHSSGVNGDYKWLKKICHYIARGFLQKKANIFLTCSREASEWMFPKLSDEKVHFIKNGVDAKKYRFDKIRRMNEREKLGFNEQVFAIGMVGDMSYQKNPFFMIDVFELLIRKNENFRLVFIGQGKNSEEIIKKIKSKNLDKYVVLYGQTKEMENVLCGIDVFAMPSKAEGFPVSAVEAQASGLPCVLSDKITRQVNICGRCSFLGIKEKDKEIWKEFFTHMKREKNRENEWKKICDAGYDIRNTAQQLLDIYGIGEKHDYEF